jgi:hypothetical protein
LEIRRLFEAGVASAFARGLWRHHHHSPLIALNPNTNDRKINMGQSVDSKTVHSSLMRSCFVSVFVRSVRFDFIRLGNLQADAGAGVFCEVAVFSLMAMIGPNIIA